jgi:hypothetical protein
MKVQNRTKRRIAKEILIFFSAILLVILIGIFIWLKNSYDSKVIQSLKAEELKVIAVLDSFELSLPGIESFDGKMFNKRTFKVDDSIHCDVAEKDIPDFLAKHPSSIEVQSFKVNRDTYDIPLNEVKDFLIYFPEATVLFPKISNSVWAVYDSTKKSKNSISGKLQNRQTNIYSDDDIIEKVGWTALIIFLVIYPFRFIVLSIVWASKTIKQKE